MSTPSKACCTIPPVITEGYQPKGQYTELNGIKTYVTGPADADTAVMLFYDIFGYSAQILQGADILAYCDKDRPKQLFMPDFFEGNPAKIEWFPPTTEEKQKARDEWFPNTAPPKHLPRVPGLLDAAEKSNPNIKSWGMVGYCWGGKLVSMISGRDTRFKAGVQTSPSMVDVADAEKIKIPQLLLPSKGEPLEDFQKYHDAIKAAPKQLVYFGNQVHGWMSARGNLQDPEVQKDYERGYQLAAGFFAQYL